MLFDCIQTDCWSERSLTSRGTSPFSQPTLAACSSLWIRMCNCAHWHMCKAALKKIWPAGHCGQWMRHAEVPRVCSSLWSKMLTTTGLAHQSFFGIFRFADRPVFGMGAPVTAALSTAAVDTPEPLKLSFLSLPGAACRH